MGTPKTTLLALGLAVACAAFFGCSGSVCYTHTSGPAIENTHPGPPPHAPAHGYRHKHADGVVLVYDSGIGVYVVSGYTSVYFYGGSFYRLSRGVWEVSRHADGKWRKASKKNVPQGILNVQVSQNKCKKNKKG